MATQTRTISQASYLTSSGMRIVRSSREVSGEHECAELLRALDSRAGMLLASSFEYPGRYKRYDYGFSDPLLVLEAGGLSRELQLRATGRRGQLLLPACYEALRSCDALADVAQQELTITARAREPEQSFSEEERTRAPNVLHAVRALAAVFESREDNLLGLYGAFGHDLVFQFESLAPRLARPAKQRDLVLYLPDRILVVDHEREHACIVEYDFELAGDSTRSIVRTHVSTAQHSASALPLARDHQPGEYAQLVTRARQAFACGDLFEVTPGQRFVEPCAAAPSRVFELLREANPAPYGFCINLGEGEHLIGASPEMYVRVTDRRIETCPIAGTIARGQDALDDAAQIKELLCSGKDEAELTMCTDVDRNDKARICEPGSVRVIGRRQIELYSRLIHTVDHVEGRLREGYDAIDAFLTHMWAVTVTGAPKQNALQFIEDHERSLRGFYGGAVGALRFDGSLDTGLVLRTISLQGGLASVRAGATLLFDSEPEAEERETELKASACFAALRNARAAAANGCSVARVPAQPSAAARAPATRVLLIDHRDSFVHTLADYFRQLGCEVTTLRFDRALSRLGALDPELVVVSPGPSRPDDFGMRSTLSALAQRALPVFGVCLGLQGMVEFCGGELSQLALPVHGKASVIRCDPRADMLRGLPERLRVGRYHSLYARANALPQALQPLAVAEEDGSCMALSHRSLPWSAVQFHPESILSAGSGYGLRLLRNVLDMVRSSQRRRQSAELALET